MTSHRTITRLCAILAAVVLVKGCADGATEPAKPPPPPPPPVATTMTVSPGSAELSAVGATVQLGAEVRDQNGREMAGAAVTWASGDASVATVDATGLVTAVENGQATVTATSGQASAGTHVTVEQQVANIDLSPSADTLVSRDTLRVIASAVDANGHAVADADFEWSSSDTLVALVDSAGLVTAAGPGQAEVSARVGETGAAARITVEFSASVAFVEDSVRLGEGAARVVGVRYRVRRLESPLPIRVTAVDDGAGPADYELSETDFEIPAGSGLEGTVALTVGAVADDFFAEGDEGLSLHLSVPEESASEVGTALKLTIADAPVSACVGVSLAGTPPRRVERGRDVVVGTTLTLEWGPEAADVHLEWAGPYPTRDEWTPNIEHHPYFRRGITRPNQPGFHLSDWRIASDGGAARHTMSLEWPAGDTLSLRLRSPRGACDGEPTASCGPDGCSLDRRAGAAGDNGPGAPGAATPSVVAAAGIVPPPAMGWPMEVVVPSMERVAGYHLGHCDWGTPATSGTMARWSPSVWPAGDTLEWFVSRANWPADAIQSAEKLGTWVQRSVFDRFSEIWTADVHMRMAGVREADEATRPTRDGMNTIHLISPEIHGGTYLYGDWNSETECFEITESDLAVGWQHAMMTDARLAQLSWSHDFGHALRLDHAATFPVRRSSPDPWGWNWEQWRAVSGAWRLDPVMSYGAAGGFIADAAGSFLRLDDKIAISLARPRPGWLARTGSISGRIQADGGPKPFVHVWALLPSTDGRMDGIGAFADEHGDFRIEGLPPGDYYLYASPDLEWLANPWFFLEGQGELLDVLLPFPIRVASGGATDGIEINMRSGRPAAPIN